MIPLDLLLILGLLAFMIAGCWAAWEPRPSPLDFPNGRGTEDLSR